MILFFRMCRQVKLTIILGNRTGGTASAKERKVERLGNGAASLCSKRTRKWRRRGLSAMSKEKLRQSALKPLE